MAREVEVRHHTLDWRFVVKPVEALRVWHHNSGDHGVCAPRGGAALCCFKQRVIGLPCFACQAVAAPAGGPAAQINVGLVHEDCTKPGGCSLRALIFWRDMKPRLACGHKEMSESEPFDDPVGIAAPVFTYKKRESDRKPGGRVCIGVVYSATDNAITSVPNGER